MPLHPHPYRSPESLTPQQSADLLLSEWQSHRFLPPALRLAATPQCAVNDNTSEPDLDRKVALVAGEMEAVR